MQRDESLFNMIPKDLKLIGIVRSVNTPKRELRLKTDLSIDEVDAIIPSGHVDKVWISISGALDVKQCLVEQAENVNGELLLRLSPGISRDLVGRMRKCNVYFKDSPTVDNDWRPKSVKNYLGMVVHQSNGSLLGVVVEVLESPAHPVLVIELENTNRLLLPCVSEVLLGVDFQKRTLNVVNDLTPYAVFE